MHDLGQDGIWQGTEQRSTTANWACRPPESVVAIKISSARMIPQQPGHISDLSKVVELSIVQQCVCHGTTVTLSCFWTGRSALGQVSLCLLPFLMIKALLLSLREPHGA